MKRKIAKITGYILLLIAVIVLPLFIDFYASYYHIQQLDPEIKKVFMDQAKGMIDEENNRTELKIPILSKKDA